MARLAIGINPEPPVDEFLPNSPTVIVSYIREIPKQDATDAEVTAAAERIFVLSRNLEGQLELSDYVPATPVQLRITTSQGVTVIPLSDLVPQRTDGDNAPNTQFTLSQVLTKSDVNRIRQALTHKNPDTKLVLLRAGRFVVVTGEQLDYRNYEFLVSPVIAGQLSSEALTGLFGTGEFHTATKLLAADELQKLSGLQLGQIHTVSISLQGRFEFAVPIDGTEAGWVWLLSGPMLFVGLQTETDLAPMRTTTILLTIPAGAAPAELRPPFPISPPPSRNGHVSGPLDATEDELLSNPDLFNDDPGSFCKPFQNPNRIVGERAFHTILRVTQPEIGGDPSVPPPETLPTFPFTPGLIVRPPESWVGGGSALGTDSRVERLRAGSGLTSLVASLREMAADNPMVTTRAALAERRRYVLANSRGRATLNSKTALEWEGDSTIYQTTSLGLGHILEFRVRWRSNGYSLGSVAHTLTLAPRQTKRILTVESRILDRARREEITRAGDVVTQQTQRDYAYSDAVQSHLNEWARGGSKASTDSLPVLSVSHSPGS